MAAPIAGRPTMYRGIRMRSRLEADYAAFLDRACPGLNAKWEYEPICFAGRHGQYLPDFRITLSNGQTRYDEVKPASLIDDPDGIFAVGSKMAVIWETDPTAWIFIQFWNYGKGLEAGISHLGLEGEWAWWWPE
jgi:hypothetical protein